MVVSGPDRRTGQFKTLLVEIKDKDGRLTDLQEKFHTRWAGRDVVVAWSVGDILAAFNWSAQEIQTACADRGLAEEA